MNLIKSAALGFAVALVLSVGSSAKADDAKTVSGKASCGHCSGAVKGGCCVMLTDSNGDRWVLKGDQKKIKEAFDARKSGKSMTATITGTPKTKKGEDGKDYKEVKVTSVKVES